MFVRRALPLCVLALAACGGNDTPDPPGVDAQTLKVMEVTSA